MERDPRPGIPDRAAGAGWRPARIGDLDAIAALMRRYYAEDGYAFDEGEGRAALARLLHERERGQMWVLERGDVLEGYAALTLGYSLEYRGLDAFVDELYLTTAARGAGLGAQALDLIVAECHRRGVRALHLEVEPHKPRALELYRKWGFRDHQRFLMTRVLTASGEAG
jgi:L-amino acid N-acyltransferase YncA